MSARQPDTLAAQLERWRAADLLSNEQAQAILDFEALSVKHGRTKFSAALIISIIGALTLGLGIIALVAANWGTLPQSLKFGGLVLLTLSSYAAGYLLRDRPEASWPGTGAALYLLGGVLFGAVLAFLSQGMQLNVNVSTLLMLWGAGLLALAYGVRLPPALHLAVPLGVVIPQLGIDSEGWGLATSTSFNALLVLVTGLLALALAWWHDHRWPTTDQALDDRTLVDKAVGRELAHPWAFWSVPLSIGGLIWFLTSITINNHWEIVMLASLALSFGLFWWGEHEQRCAVGNWALLGLGLSLYSLCSGVGGLFYALLGGVLALKLALWGGKVNQRRLVNLGLVGVGMAVLGIYFSLFSWLNISLLLVGAGLLLLALGYNLEPTRRRLTAVSEGEG